MSLKNFEMRGATAVVTMAAFLVGVVGMPREASAVVSASAPEPTPAAQSALTIHHDELACVVTDLAPQIDAQVAPVPQFDKGYVYFKASGTEDFYYTPMKGPAQNLEGVLPRPLPETRAIDYKVRARDVEFLTKETREYAPPVVPGNACKTKGLAVGSAGAGLTIGLTREGQNPAPPGFNRRDIAFIILFGGATVTLAQALGGSAGASTSSSAATAKGSGGVSRGALIAGGAVVAAGAALVIAHNTGGSHRAATPVPSSTPTPTRTPTATPTPTTTLQFVVAAATWSGAGDVDVQIQDSTGQSVGSRLPAGCESTLERTETVLLQNAPSGNYRMILSAKSCGTGTPSSIAVAASVQSNSVPKCVNSFFEVPVGGSLTACSFTLP